MTLRLLVSTLVTASALTLLASSCGKETPSGQQPGPRAQAPAASVTQPASPITPQVKTIYQARCLVCHGATGAGDGTGAAALNPKPRDFSDPTWQASVTDDHIKKVIVEGGVAVGKSAGMPAHDDLKSKSDVMTGLVALIRSYKKTQ